MKKLNRFLAAAICAASVNLWACSPGPGTEPVPTSTPTATSSPTASPTITPTSSPTPATQYSYDFPLKVTSDGECNLGSKTLYEVKTDGTFNYLTGTNGSEKTETRKLSQDEINGLKNLLFELDIAKLAEKDTQIPPGSPQTTECRSVENYNMIVNGQNRTFDRNGRLASHTSDYTAALIRLKNKLDSLKSSYTYELPLLVSNNNECAATAVNKITHQVNTDGTYTYITTENGSEKTVSRKLSASEITSLKDLLKDLNLANLAEQDTVVPPGAPQTTECRLIENFSMSVNGKERTFDRNGRQLIHTQAYLDALTKLKTRLEELKNPSEVKYVYNLPLKITLNNECTTPVPNRVIYEVKADGTYTYIKSENDLSQTGTRKLTDLETSDLKLLLKDVDIAQLAEADQPVDPNSPQTLECRSIENYSMLVNGTEKTFDKNGRLLVHTQAYLDGLARIKTRLEELARK
jgi:hypothetical protein